MIRSLLPASGSLLTFLLLAPPSATADGGPIIPSTTISVPDKAEGVKPPFSKATVKPGKSHDNGDTVVMNDMNSMGDITVDPKTGNANSSTTIDFETRVTGSVTGLDSNDTVNLSSTNTANITGTGGTVNVNGTGTTATVMNNGTSGSVTVNGPGGMTVTIPPGSTAIVST